MTAGGLNLQQGLLVLNALGVRTVADSEPLSGYSVAELFADQGRAWWKFWEPGPSVVQKARIHKAINWNRAKDEI